MSDTQQRFSRVAYPPLGDAGGHEHAAQAQTRGHAAGYAAGLRRAEAEETVRREQLEAAYVERVTAFDARSTAVLGALTAAVAALHARTAPVLADAEDAVVAAAMELAEAVVGYEIRASRPSAPSSTTDPAGQEAHQGSGARATVARALASIDPDAVVTLRLAPSDVAALAGTELPVVVVADPSLRPGDAVADLPHGVLDARIASALDRARTALGLGVVSTVGSAR